jgi:outer membrane receptor for ferrienterochelin and colicins
MKNNQKFKQIKIMVLSFIAVFALAFACYAEEQVQTEEQSQTEEQAQIEDSAELEKVVVTASRIEQEIKDTPATVEVITREDIEAMGAQTLRDALSKSTSIGTMYIMNGTGVTMRGSLPKHTLILIDGQRLATEGSATLAGGYEWDRINMDDVERIEIIRSNASALYGSDALGGVIKVITKKPWKNEFSMSYMPSSYRDDSENRNEDFSLRFASGKRGPFAMSVSAGQKHTDPYNKTQYDTNYNGTRQYLTLNGSYELNEMRQLDFKADFLSEDMKQLLGGYYNNTYNNNRRTYSLGLQGAHAQGDYMLRTYYTEQVRDTVSRLFTMSDNSKREVWTWDGWNSNRIGVRHVLTTGFEVRDETYRGARVENGEADNVYYAVYAQDEYKVNDKLLIEPSLRYDDSDKFSDNISPKLGMTYKFNDNYRLKASVGEGFKAPTLDDLYMRLDHGFSIIYGNPDLEPEKSTDYEMGFEGEIGKFFGKVTYFYKDVTNLIGYDYDNDKGGMVAKNVSDTDLKGVELELGVDITSNLLAKMSYTYLDAIDPDTEERLMYRAKNSGTFQLRYDNNNKKGLSVMLWNSWVDHYRYVKRDWHYVIWNISLNKKWNRNVSSYISVNNIYDKKNATLDIYGKMIRAGLTIKI